MNSQIKPEPAERVVDMGGVAGKKDALLTERCSDSLMDARPCNPERFLVTYAGADYVPKFVAARGAPWTGAANWLPAHRRRQRVFPQPPRGRIVRNSCGARWLPGRPWRCGADRRSRAGPQTDST